MDVQQPADRVPSSPMGSPFEHACERCGTYAPLSAKYGPELCAECIERTAHPIVQTPTSVGDILSGVFQLLRVVGLPSALVLVLGGLPMSIIEFLVPDLPFAVSNLWGFFVGTLSEMVVLHLAWQAIAKRDQRIDVGAAFAAVGQRLGALLATRFVCNFMTLLFTLLLIVPGVMKALSLSLAMPIALHESYDASAAIAASTSRMQGHRWTAFLAYCVASAPLFLLLGTIVCVGVAQGLSQELAQGAQGAGTAAETATDGLYAYANLALGIITPAALLPVALVPAVLYAKLQRTDSGFRI